MSRSLGMSMSDTELMMEEEDYHGMHVQANDALSGVSARGSRRKDE